ncbi:Phosphate import ATP-binding protein pstB 1 [Nitrospina gracilis 3/211]|uniref:Phosphate import ATP-binding protein pstB 1 n=1 Tax=Nitrospina gracilis (strain 3/211) TaxID=1266370 RepID=M1YW15_NITG3|nr:MULTISPECIES: phosphate ABC transporter ATP-binding protein [Nitrospina]MCF8722883.1 putative ABC transport system ATP-binding protein [Nitrospina sp. Nb-3]CCQ89845.1 Phosphate import ATP-binding protein pstB 1 [Nitrospina gracilis 3/211]
MLQVRELSVTRGRPILNGVSFDVEKGEMLVVLGPSGSGKSMLLRSLNRLEPFDAGTVRLNGQDTARMNVLELRRRMGMVFQAPALLPFRVRDNIALGPGLRGEVMEDAKCEHLLNQVGLSKTYLTRQAETLSGGEQQRVALAQMLANGPELLLMDEPTSALDPTAALTIENLIKHINRDLGIAAVWVTHDVPQALRFDAMTMVLIEGRIVAHGNIQELMNDRKDERLRQFFEGTLHSGPEGGAHAG